MKHYFRRNFEQFNYIIILYYFFKRKKKKKYHLPLFFSQFLCIFSDGYIFIYKRDIILEVIAIYSMVRLIAILLFGIFLINSVSFFYQNWLIEKFWNDFKKERRTDE